MDSDYDILAKAQSNEIWNMYCLPKFRGREGWLRVIVARGKTSLAI